MNDGLVPPVLRKKGRKPPPLTSFGPELLSALRRAGQAKVSIEFKQYSLAVRFQQRIYQLRMALQRENHPDYPMTSRVTSRILWGKRANPTWAEPLTRTNSNNVVHPASDAPCILELYPKDSEFVESLNSAGIKIDAPEPIEQQVPATSAPDLSFLDSYLEEPKDE